MKKILFVEDSDLLRGIFALMLATERDHWETKVVASGTAALELMKETAFDVVASDLGMPGMNGIELLKEVGERYPQTARIIISGMGDQASVAEALGSTHQFLLKPVELKTLRGTLVRINGLDAYLKDEKLKALAGRLGVLPSFPTLYLEIMQAIGSPNANLKNITDLVTKDPGITAKMLQLVNSTAFGLRYRVHDPVVATQQLGMNTIRSMVLSSHVFATLKSPQLKNFSADELWSHLMKCGRTARAIMQAEKADFADVEDAFTAGILHDIGKLMLADSLPGEFQKALTLAAEKQIPLHEAEMEIFGATHAGLAAYLLGLWGLPAAIVEAVAFHHTPEKSTNPHFSPLTAVHVANALEHELDQEQVSLNENYLADIGIENRLSAWRKEAKEAKETGEAVV